MDSYFIINMLKTFMRYVGVTSSLGAVRAAYYSNYVKKKYYDDKYRERKRDLLLSEKVGMTVRGAFAHPLLMLRVSMFELRKFEVALRGIDENLYNTKIEYEIDIYGN